MHVIEVIPLRRGIQVESLSYFSSAPYPAGTMVEIPLRSKTALAMVLTCEPVSTTKTALKAATFSLRKLPEQTDTRTLPTALLKTAESLSSILPFEVGAILFSLLPAEIRNGTRALPDVPESELPKTVREKEPPKVLQAARSDRYITYRSIVRETFAHGGSVLFVVPTSADLEFARASLETGIEERVICFSPAHTKNEREKAYAGFNDFSKSKLIITTPTHAYLDRHDITTVIVDSARSANYQSRQRPYVHHLDALTIYATHTDRAIVLGDVLPRTEDEYKRRSDEYLTVGEHPKRLALPGKLSVVAHTEKPTSYEPFPLFTDNTITAVEETIKNRGLVYMFAARRGLAPVVACSDCGYVFRCPESGAPYSLLRTMKDGEELRWFISGTSGKRLRAADVCPDCGSWRLRERGIGIQQMHDAARSIFTDTDIVLFDHTTATTYKRALTLRDRFYDAKRGAILLGTAMAIPYLHKPITTSVVTSMDALQSNPTWRNQEEILGLLLTLRERTTDTVLVQTRGEVDEVIRIATQGAVEQFYDEEIELRNSLSYPPFAVFIHLTWSGTPESVQDTETEITEKLRTYPLTTYSAPESTGSKIVRYGLIRNQEGDWPDRKLIDILKALPPNIRIMINPDRIV